MIQSFDARLARQAWRGAFTAALLNVLGMPIDYLITRTIPGMPAWPNLFSFSVGAGLMVLLLARRRHPSISLESITFLINTLSIALALWVTADSFAASGKTWTPFQANKLGALTVGLLAPELWVGALSVLAYAGAAVLKFYLFSPEIRARLPIAEPWATVAFGVFGLAVLIHRVRQLTAERRVVRAQAESAALEEVARSLLAVLDLANTPLQNIEINISLIEQQGSSGLAPFVGRIKRSLERLRESSRLLSSYEARLKWQSGDTSFDPRRKLG